MATPAPLRATRHPNLFIRGRIFYFRAALPVFYDPHDSRRKHLCFSLLTSDLETAKLLSSQIKARLMEIITNGNLDTSNPEIRDGLRKLAREYFQEALEKGNESLELDEGMDDWNRDELEADTTTLIDQLTNGLKQSAFPGYINAKADELLSQHLASARKNIEIQKFLKKLLMRAQIQAERIFLAKVSGNPPRIEDELFQGIDPESIPPVPESVSATGEFIYSAQAQATNSLDKAIEDFLQAKRAKDKDDKTVDDIALALRAFRFTQPNIRTLPQITKAAIVDYEVHLTRLPARYTIKKDLKDLSYEELVAVGKDMKKMSPSSQDKYNGNFRSFINWCEETDRTKLGKLPAYELRDKTPNKEKRDPFTDDELKKFFSNPQYTGHAPDTDKGHLRRYEPGSQLVRDFFYWIPLVALYTGMRLGEIVQLHLADVREEGGTLYFDVTEVIEGKVSKELRKSLKNAPSRRKVPLHPDLLKVGFGEFIKHSRQINQTRLFYDAPVTKKGKPGDEYSRRFGRYLVKLGLKHDKLVFHSFRHTFIDYAIRQAKLPDHTVTALVGHREDSITHNTYGSKLTISELYQSIKAIKFPINLSTPASTI